MCKGCILEPGPYRPTIESFLSTMRNRIGTILILICLGCKYSNKNIEAISVQNDSSKKGNGKVNIKSDTKLAPKVSQDNSSNPNQSKLTCDSLLILLIKSSSIDKTALSERAVIDSIKKRVIYLTFSHINKENSTEHNLYYLEVDLNKRELREIAEQSELLNFDRRLLTRIIDQKCYDIDADYVTAPQQQTNSIQ